MIAGVLVLAATLGFLVLQSIPLFPIDFWALIGSAILGTSLLLIGFLLILPKISEAEGAVPPAPTKGGEIPQRATFGSLRIGSTTDVGRKRTLNEDSIMAIETQSAFEANQVSRCVVIVGDGMGGHQKGEVASAIGVRTVAEVVQRSLLDGEADLAGSIRQAIEEANNRILDYSVNHSECQGMGTTLTAAVIDGQQLVVGHVGDSRAYVIDENEIVQITRDHSMVQDMVEKGQITREQARNHPSRNVITRVVGYYGKVEPDIFRATLKEGDRVLVCCDGLVIHLTDEEIKQIVLQTPDPQEASSKLVTVANEKGGQDNISVIVATVRGVSA
jgi:protein phosphatase